MTGNLQVVSSHVWLHHHSQARSPGAPQRLHAVSAGSLLLRKGPQVEAEALLVDEAVHVDIHIDI